LAVADKYTATPCVDGKILPDNQLNILKADAVNDVNLITGNVIGGYIII